MVNTSESAEVASTPLNDTLMEAEERMLVHKWRFALEGVLIPCIGLPGILGGKFIKLIKLNYIEM